MIDAFDSRFLNFKKFQSTFLKCLKNRFNFDQNDIQKCTTISVLKKTPLEFDMLFV